MAGKSCCWLMAIASYEQQPRTPIRAAKTGAGMSSMLTLKREATGASEPRRNTFQIALDILI
jgi:hypothetical protein